MQKIWIFTIIILLSAVAISVNAHENPLLNIAGHPALPIKPNIPDPVKLTENASEKTLSNPDQITLYTNESKSASYVNRIVTIENANKTKTVWINIIAGPYGTFQGTSKECHPTDCYSGKCCPTVNCPYLSCGSTKCNKGSLSLPSNGGFMLGPGKSTKVIVKVLKNKGSLTGAGGITVWARTGCKATRSEQYPLICDTANCDLGGGLSKVSCGGIGSKPPATKAEITFDGASHNDFYDISLVDGYNVPMTLTPVSGNYVKDPKKPLICKCAGGVKDLISLAKKELPLMLYKVNGKAVGVYSACQYSVLVNPKTQDAAFCCSGRYANDPKGCAKNVANWPKSKQTAKFFNRYYPKAYSFAYGDNRGLFTCRPNDNKPINYKLTIYPTKMT